MKSPKIVRLRIIGTDEVNSINWLCISSLSHKIFGGL